MLDDALELIGVIFTILVVWFFVCFAFVWFDGHAKSSWIRRSRGIEVPWNEAAFLTVTISSVDTVDK